MTMKTPKITMTTILETQILSEFENSKIQMRIWKESEYSLKPFKDSLENLIGFWEDYFNEDVMIEDSCGDVFFKRDVFLETWERLRKEEKDIDENVTESTFRLIKFVQDSPEGSTFYIEF